MNDKTTFRERVSHLTPVIGSVLVLSGILLFIDQRIKTNWLSISIPLAIGLLVLAWGSVRKQLGALILGFLIFAGGGALFFGLQQIFTLSQNFRLVLIFSIIALSLFLIFVLLLVYRHRLWWLLFVPVILTGLVFQFSFQKLGLLEFILVHSVAVSLVFLIWGIFERKIGLVIPGALIGTMGMGVYTAWNELQKPEALQSTGIMLVWFALGWILVTVFNRIIHKKFTWWPLIPGGVMLMVGAGLYLGGNPENAVGFFGNTGSVALILLGIYLILMKFGMNHRNR
jgi:hypothetical protein